MNFHGIGYKFVCIEQQGDTPHFFVFVGRGQE